MLHKVILRKIRDRFPEAKQWLRLDGFPVRHPRELAAKLKRMQSMAAHGMVAWIRGGKHVKNGLPIPAGCRDAGILGS